MKLLNGFCFCQFLPPHQKTFFFSPLTVPKYWNVMKWSHPSTLAYFTVCFCHIHENKTKSIRPMSSKFRFSGGDKSFVKLLQKECEAELYCGHKKVRTPSFKCQVFVISSTKTRPRRTISKHVPLFNATYNLGNYWCVINAATRWRWCVASTVEEEKGGSRRRSKRRPGEIFMREGREKNPTRTNWNRYGSD